MIAISQIFFPLFIDIIRRRRPIRTLRSDPTINTSKPLHTRIKTNPRQTVLYALYNPQTHQITYPHIVPKSHSPTKGLWREFVKEARNPGGGEPIPFVSSPKTLEKFPPVLQSPSERSSFRIREKLQCSVSMRAPSRPPLVQDAGTNISCQRIAGRQ
jgi:hypothetical protein